jgi:glutaredoxin
VKAGERVALEKTTQLNLALELGETQVHVEDVHGAVEVVVADSQFGVQDAAAFLRPQRQVDIGGLDDRKAAEHRVAVLAAATHVDVAKPGAVGQSHQLGQAVDLAITVGTLGPIVDFLQQDDVRLEIKKGGRGALRVVPAVEAADALVDVVGDDAELQPGQDIRFWEAGHIRTAVGSVTKFGGPGVLRHRAGASLLGSAAMSESASPAKAITKRATERLFSVLNRADELGGELRDYLQEKVLVNPRYVSARRRLAEMLGKSYTSKQESTHHAAAVAVARAAVAAPTPTVVKTGERVLGNPEIKAQVYGKKSCPWSGRAISLFERHKVDFDFVDLEEPEYEILGVRLANETHQHTVPYVYLRGQFIGGFNALSEVERLGQLEYSLMSADERKNAPAHLRVEVSARPNTDETAPGDTEIRDDAK